MGSRPHGPYHRPPARRGPSASCHRLGWRTLAAPARRTPFRNPYAPRFVSPRVKLALALVVALALLPHAIATYPDRSYETTLTLEKGAGTEIDLVVQSAGDFVRYEWSSNGPKVAFDVHTHAGGSFTTVAKTTASSASDVFEAKAAGTYSLAFEPEADALVTVKLMGPFKLAGDKDPTAASKTPAASFAFTVLASAAVALATRRARR